MVDTDDVQALALSPYSGLGYAAYLPLAASTKQPAMATWLDGLLPAVTCGRLEKTAKVPRATNVAFSHAGLRELALDRRALGGFSAAFRSGMFDESHPQRSWDLGDVGDSGPEKWRWGSGTKRPLALLMLYADRQTELGAMVEAARSSAAGCGLEPVTGAVLEAAWPRRDNVHGFREHFGFVDGISQPRIDLGDGSGDAPADPSLLAAGELLLGYPNETGAVSRSPSVPLSKAALDADLAELPGTTRRDLGRNGTYLVFRQLEQDVLGFWRFAAAHADLVGSIELCAAKLIGRWRNGAPLTLFPENPGALDDARDHNDFRFRKRLHDDEKGMRCPLGAHIRRANPRDALPGRAPRHSLAQVRRHRIFRRGRPYGTAVGGWPDPIEMLKQNADSGERGTYFVCLNASIKRQFEHVQRRWLNDPTFVSTPNDEVDPIAGRVRARTRFLVPKEPVPVLLGDGDAACRCVITMRGGGYFFLPSKRALRYLATAA